MTRFLRRGLAGIFLAATALGHSTAVTAMTVQPVVVNLATAGRAMSQVVTVENTFTNPLPVEIRVAELSVGENGIVSKDTDPGDILVFPPQALIQPGQTQSFRVQYVGDPDLAASKHFYATVAQLPVQLPQGQSAIQILYNFQVLVSVAPQGVKPNVSIVSAEVGQDEGGKPVPLVLLANDSRAHGFLSQGRLRIIQRDTSGKEVFRKTLSGPEIQQTIGFGLVGARQRRKVLIPMVLPQEGGSVEAQFTPDS